MFTFRNDNFAGLVMLPVWAMIGCLGKCWAPEFTYGRGLYKCFKKFDIDKNDWHNLARDRLMWNHVVRNG